MKSIRKMARYLKPYRTWLIVSFVLVAIEAIVQLMVPRLTQYVIDGGITPGNMRAIMLGSGLMLFVAVLGAGATVQRAVFAAKYSQSIAYDIRNDLFDRIQRFSFGNLDQLQTGQLITRVSSDVDIVRMFMSMGFIMIIRGSVLVLGSYFFLITTNARLSMIMLIIIPAIAILFGVIARIAQPLFKIVQERLDKLNSIVQENLAGREVVKAFVREKFEIENYEMANESYMRQAIKVNRLMTIVFPLVSLIANLGIVAVVILGGTQVIQGTLSVGEMVAFTNYLMTATYPVIMLGMIISMLPSADASAERILEILETQPEIGEKKDAVPLEGGQGRVVFENVSFHYNGSSDEEVLQGINFEINPGQNVALLGATGSGKTSLVSLIPRLYDVSDGRVLIDGRDVRELDLQSLRANVGIAMQQTTLFSGTIAENISFGKPEASREEIIAAARAAQAHDFIMARPDGYESEVESRGANLSGGQKQRIAIARALLVNPCILILDDSTSSVDMETEFQIQEALDKLMENRTTIIIAQRLSSVLKADTILILDKGSIAASGSHHDLLESSDIYREIYGSQLGEAFEGGIENAGAREAAMSEVES